MDLSYNKLNDKDMSLIASEFWPNLHCPSVAGSALGPDGRQQRTKGDWPVITTCILDL